MLLFLYHLFATSLAHQSDELQKAKEQIEVLKNRLQLQVNDFEVNANDILNNITQLAHDLEKSGSYEINFTYFDDLTKRIESLQKEGGPEFISQTILNLLNKFSKKGNPIALYYIPHKKLVLKNSIQLFKSYKIQHTKNFTFETIFPMTADKIVFDLPPNQNVDTHVTKANLLFYLRGYLVRKLKEKEVNNGNSYDIDTDPIFFDQIIVETIENGGADTYLLPQFHVFEPDRIQT